jgi:K+-sensing histidine kinase KdpD
MVTHAKNQRFRGLLDSMNTRRLYNFLFLHAASSFEFTRCVQYVSTVIVRMSLSVFCSSLFIQVKQQNSGSFKTEGHLKTVIDFIFQCAANLSVTGFWRQQYAYYSCHICPSVSVHRLSI